MDRHRETDQRTGKTLDTIGVGVWHHNVVAGRQQELGGARDAVGVRRPGRQPEHRQISARARLGGEILNEAEQRQQDVRRGVAPGVIRMPRISMSTRMRTVTGSPPVMGLQGVKRSRNRGECRLEATTRTLASRERKRMRTSAGWRWRWTENSSVQRSKRSRRAEETSSTDTPRRLPAMDAIRDRDCNAVSDASSSAERGR